MPEQDEAIRDLRERVERLEKQIAVLMKQKKTAPAARPGRDLRDRYDALDYPE